MTTKFVGEKQNHLLLTLKIWWKLLATRNLRTENIALWGGYLGILYGHSEPAPTSTPSIHWMPVIPQLWMNLN